MHQSFYQSNLTAERVTSLNLDILPLISSPDRVCVMLDVGRLHRTGHFRSRVKKKKEKRGTFWVWFQLILVHVHSVT